MAVAFYYVESNEEEIYNFLNLSVKYNVIGDQTYPGILTQQPVWLMLQRRLEIDFALILMCNQRRGGTRGVDEISMQMCKLIFG